MPRVLKPLDAAKSQKDASNTLCYNAVCAAVVSSSKLPALNHCEGCVYQVPQTSRPITPIGALFSQTLDLIRRHSGTFMALAALQAIPALLFGMYSYAIGLSQRATVQIEQLLEEVQRRTQTGNPDDLMGFPWGMNIDAVVDLLGISLISLLISSFIMRAFVQGATVRVDGGRLSRL